MDGQVVAVEAVSKRFGSVQAVDEVTVTVERGEIYALLGLNGAGKTTLIRMLLGMVRPDGGEIRVFGTVVRPGVTSVWTRVGYLVETPAGYPDLTVRENLSVAARLRGLRGRRTVQDVVDLLGLAPYADRRTRGLSLGNAQRLGLAKALLHGPDLLVLDEPANALDPAGVVEIRELLRDLAEQGVTVFVSSHALAEVARLATRIGVLHAGRLRAELTAAELAARARSWLTVDTRDNVAAGEVLRGHGYEVSSGGDGLRLAGERAVAGPDDVAARLVRAGHPPVRLVVEHEDLEAYFLRLVGGEDA
jgi:ABC-2 type transport system ATP-binding protein